MRRILSILLLGLLLYNMVGYSVVYLTESRYEVNASAVNLLHQSSHSTDIVIKVPVAVPYQNDWEAPEPAEGQIEHEGQFYEMKSRQLLNDTLYVTCELDQSARERFAELVSKINDQVTGQSSAPEKSHSNILKHFVKEYMNQDRKHVFFVMEWTPSTSPVHSHTSAVFHSEKHFKIPSPPPDLV